MNKKLKIELMKRRCGWPKYKTLREILAEAKIWPMPTKCATELLGPYWTTYKEAKCYYGNPLLHALLSLGNHVWSDNTISTNDHKCSNISHYAQIWGKVNENDLHE